MSTFAEAKAALTKAGHIHISEREADGTWEDCTWDSGLEWFRLVYDARKPATHAEAQLLRRASGEPATGGSNMGDLARGIKARYGVTIPARISGFAALKTALTPGKVAVIQGSMKAFGPDHPLSKYDRNFDGAHALVLANVGGVLLWCDPEAPTTASVPVQVTWSQVEAFVKAFAGQHVVGRIRLLPTTQPAPTGGDMAALVKYLPGYTANIKPSSNLRSAPLIQTATLVRTTGTTKESVNVIGTVKGDVDPANGSTEWYEVIAKGVRVYTAKDNILDLKAPAVTDGFTKATQDAAVKAAVDPLNAKVVEQAGIIADLKNRLAPVEGLRVALKNFLG